MQKTLITLGIISLALLPLASSAQDTSTSTRPNREEKRETIRDQVEAKKEAVQNQMEERRSNALDKIKERVSDLMAKVIKRFEAAVERLEKLSDRIESRIKKMEAGGIDVIKAKELLATANLKIEVAKASVAGITLPLTNTVSGTSSTTALVKEKYSLLRTQIAEAKEDIKAAHAALVDVIRNLKPGANKVRTGANATTTATTTNNN